ncbi:hypothetical protein [Flavobacterium sp. UBA6195]|uniref:hypothetical protein n=1 Tax=Flavobacterium sp. UBA6195 TaxID=1946554 RepID=UPI0025BC3968|nr:hypothetical protein [Flavobacterium sp. UBA6195]
MKTIKILFLFVGMIVSVKVSAQTFDLNTNHTSISMKTKNLGYTADISITNNHVSDLYIVSYTVEFTLKCGGTKTYSENEIGIKAGKTDDTGGYTISIPEVKGCERGISGANLIKFSANKKETTSTQSSSLSNSNNQGISSNVNHDPKPGPNASVQELAAWQRRQNTVNNTSTTTTSSQNYNNYDNNTATQNNNNQGVTQADLNALLERNAQESNRILGLSPTNTNKTTEQVASEGLWSLADAWVQSRQERLEREEREEERKRIQAENERIEKENRQRIINNRSVIINKFSAKDIPLSSREKASKIYYFVYAFENNNLNQEYGATVYVSNVFEIGTFNDGTRAYTSTVKNEIINLTPFNEVLHGYYYSEVEAESIRKSFIELLKNNGVSIINISYKGKPGTKTATTTTNLTQTNESKYGKTININDQNFAPATLNDPKSTEVPKRNIEKATEEEKKKQSKYGKTIKID